MFKSYNTYLFSHNLGNHNNIDLYLHLSDSFNCVSDSPWANARENKETTSTDITTACFIFTWIKIYNLTMALCLKINKSIQIFDIELLIIAEHSVKVLCTVCIIFITLFSNIHMIWYSFVSLCCVTAGNDNECEDHVTIHQYFWW